MTAKEKDNKQEQKVIEIRNIYFVAYLKTKGYEPLKVKTIDYLHIWCFPYSEEIFNLQREFYLNTQIQDFISALKDIKRLLMEHNTGNTYNKEDNDGKGKNNQ
jgi:hypothetical protein